MLEINQSIRPGQPVSPWWWQRGLYKYDVLDPQSFYNPPSELSYIWSFLQQHSLLIYKGSNKRSESMKSDYLKNKKAFLEQIKAVIASRMATRAARRNTAFVDAYFHAVPFQELQQELAVTFASMVTAQVNFIHQRRPGELLLRVYNPGKDKDGWECQHTVIEMVNEDRPFLVDTTSQTLQELNLGIHLIVHPMLNLVRDSQGKLETISPEATSETTTESFIQVQVDRPNRPCGVGEYRNEAQGTDGYCQCRR